MERVKEIFKKFNISCFVEYYHVFEQSRNQRSNEAIIDAFRKNNESWTDDGCKTRASKGKKIFNEGLEIDALRYVIDSSNPNKVSQEIIDKAHIIYSSLKKLDPNFATQKNNTYTIEHLLIDAEYDQIEKNGALSAEEKKALVKIRINQSSYRHDLINLWNGCAVTGVANELMVIASHIKPFAECNTSERYDKFNGILLSPCYDRLFDSYLISFNNDGEMLFSNRISKADLEKLRVSSNDRLRFIFPENHKYLELHRKKFYDLNNDDSTKS